MINPYHIQPGLIMDVDITSVKRKKFTLSGMANVLNEFLHGVSKGFADAAFASYTRRRSTVRADIAQSFAEGAARGHQGDRSRPRSLFGGSDGGGPGRRGSALTERAGERQRPR